MTSFDHKTTSKETSPEVKPGKSKNKFKSGGNAEINVRYIGEILQKKTYKWNWQRKLFLMIKQ